MLSRIKAYFVREHGLSRDQMTALGRLPAGGRLERLSVVLHDVCVKTAARFVEEEHQRPDSPFGDLPKTELFHELLVMNFWVLESLFKGTRQPLMDKLYRRYSASFAWGGESSPQELLDSFRGKFRAYDKSWDEFTGHQDVFARQAIGIIFGGRQIAAAPQAAFWLITYADRTMKDFARVKESVDRLLGEAAGPASAEGNPSVSRPPPGRAP